MANFALQHSEGEILSRLERILTEGGNGNFLVVSVGDVYVQFSAGKGEKLIYCEAVSNRYLPSWRQLGKAQIEHLEGLGFEEGAHSPNYSRVIEAGDDSVLEELAAQTVGVFTEAYGCDPEDEVCLKEALEDIEHPSNPDLLAAMDRLAANESHENWNNLVHALLSAIFLVPVDENSRDKPDGPVLLFIEGPDGKPALPAFTDYDSVLTMNSEGMPYAMIPGAHLFPIAQQEKFPSVVINPACPTSRQITSKFIDALAVAAAGAPLH